MYTEVTNLESFIALVPKGWFGRRPIMICKLRTGTRNQTSTQYAIISGWDRKGRPVQLRLNMLTTMEAFWDRPDNEEWLKASQKKLGRIVNTLKDSGYRVLDGLIGPKP